MNVPTLPTDSLYKFLFVFGILMVIGSRYLFEMNAKERSHNMELLSDKSNRIFAQNDSLYNVEKKVTNQDTMQIRYFIHKLRFAMEDLKIIDMQLKNDRSSFNSDVESLRLITIIGWLFAWVGALAWYFKGQKQLDKLLNLQVEKIQLEISEASKRIGRYHFEPKILPAKKQKQINNDIKSF